MYSDQTSRNEIFWQVMQTLPQGMPVKDGLLVAAVVQVMDDAVTEERLREIGSRLAREELSDCDREVLRTVFKECLRAVRMSGGN